MEKLWLTYYNDTLFEKGIIAEEDYHKMKLKINTR